MAKLFLICYFCLAVISSFFLTGCMDIATTGAQAVYNQHNIKKNLHDQYISLQAYKALNQTTLQFRDANIAVATYNGEVLLTGQVPKAWQKARAEVLIKRIPTVKQVYNTLDVAGPSSFLEQVSDAWLTAKIKSKLMVTDDIDATQIKVVTENGTVYLMGVLPKEQAEIVTQVVQDTDGVQKIVRLFSYITVSKHLEQKEQAPEQA